MPNANTPRRLPVREQRQDRLYEMSIRFVADAIPTELETVARGLGIPETPVAANAVTTRIRQTTSFIPDDETLARYASIIESASDGNARLVNVRFDGYDYIYAVAREDRDPSS